MSELLTWGIIIVVYIAAFAVLQLEKHWHRTAEVFFTLATLFALGHVAQWAWNNPDGLRGGVAFVVAIAALAVNVWFVQKVEADIRREARRFMVQRSTQIAFLSTEDGTPTFWMYKDYAQLPNALCPIDIIVLIRIVNVQAAPAMIDGYRIDMQFNQSPWVTLINMGTGSVYNVGKSLLDGKGFGEAKEIKFQRGFLDDNLDGKHINGGETVEGWAFFELPRETSAPWGEKIHDTALRIEIQCTDGDVFASSLETLPHIDGIVLRPVVLTIGEIKDFSDSPRIWYSELIK